MEKRLISRMILDGKINKGKKFAIKFKKKNSLTNLFLNFFFVVLKKLIVNVSQNIE